MQAELAATVIHGIVFLLNMQLHINKTRTLFNSTFPQYHLVIHFLNLYKLHACIPLIYTE